MDLLGTASLIALASYAFVRGGFAVLDRLAAWHARRVRTEYLRHEGGPPRSVEAPDLPRPRLVPRPLADYPIGHPRYIDPEPPRATYRAPARVERDLVCPHCGGVAGKVIAQASDAVPGEHVGLSSRTGRGA